MQAKNILALIYMKLASLSKVRSINLRSITLFTGSINFVAIPGHILYGTANTTIDEQYLASLQPPDPK
jgi:hypothetical protein